MPDRTIITEGQMRLILFAVEHGYVQCEKGNNLQAALATVHEMYRVQKPIMPREVTDAKI